MAEFMEVMCAAKRMCKTYDESCTGCPLYNDICDIWGIRENELL